MERRRKEEGVERWQEGEGRRRKEEKGGNE